MDEELADKMAEKEAKATPCNQSELIEPLGANMARKREPPVRAKWELYLDSSFYDMWAVREQGDKDFSSPRLFHFIHKDEAEQFKVLIEKSYHAVRCP